jgi:hypothetical protein
MKTKPTTWRRGLLNFHQDEDGMEALQVVMLVAIAAIILIFLKSVIWPRIRGWVQGKINELTSD